MPTGIYIRTDKHKYWLGKKHPEIKKYFTNKGNHHTIEAKEKIRLKAIGRKHSRETLIKMSISAKGRPSPRKGKHHTVDAKIKLSMYKGILNSQWKGGITPIVRHLRQIKEYKDWRFSIFTRDYFSCKKCGNKTNLHKKIFIVAHHKKEFNIIFHEFLSKFPRLSPIYDWEKLVLLATKYKSFWELDNGITLCNICHSKELINEEC